MKLQLMEERRRLLDKLSGNLHANDAIQTAKRIAQINQELRQLALKGDR